MAINLTDYASQMAEAARARKMAEVLQTDAITPIESQTVNGNPVPISGISVLAKALAGYASRRKDSMADEQEASAKNQARSDAISFMKTLPGTSEFTKMTPITAAESNPNFDTTDAVTGNFRAANTPLAAPDMTKQPAPEMMNIGVPSVPDNFQPTANTQKGINEQLSGMTPPQEIAKALQAQMPATATGDFNTPTPSGPARPSIDSETMAPAPQAQPAYGNAAPTMTPQSQVITAAHTNTPQEKMAMLMEAMNSGNPLLEKIALPLYATEQQKDSASRLLSTMNLDKLPTDTQQQIRSLAASGASTADIMKAFSDATKPMIVGKTIQQWNMPTGRYEMVANAEQTWKQVPTDELTDEQKKALSPGMIILRGSNGDYKTVNFSDAKSILGLQQQLDLSNAEKAPERANAAANLRLSQAEFNRNRLSPPTTVEYIANGEPIQVTAMFNKTNGTYISMDGHTIPTDGLRVLPNGGARATLGLLRVTTAAADAATGIDNLANLPANSNLGWFSQAANTPRGALNRILSPQEAQDMRTTVAGLSRAMGGLATGGTAVNVDTQQSYDALIPQAGQTRFTALRQMGELRQQANNAIESALANPFITPPQKKNLLAAQAKIAHAVPWLPNDISALETSKNPNATMRGMGVGAQKPPPPPAAVNMLIKNPGMAEEFKTKYGNYAYIKAVGG